MTEWTQYSTAELAEIVRFYSLVKENKEAQELAKHAQEELDRRARKEFCG